jgi:hypothetical protein
MDGRVLAGAFAEGYLDAFPVTTVEGPGSGKQSAADYTEEGEKEIVERLEGLGYLG